MDRFNKKDYRKIRDIEDSYGGYGIFIPFPKHDGDYSYICGFNTKVSAGIPEGMVSHLQPETRYAVFTYKSPIRNTFDMSGIPAMYSHIFCTWIPTSNYKYNNQAFVFEYYQRSRMMSEFPEYDIYVPIIEK